MRHLSLWSLLLLVLFFSSCKDDEAPEPVNPTDQALEEALLNLSNGEGISKFILPDENDFTNIPQDPLNPITRVKVELGRLLYHETGLAISPMHPMAKGTYSCATCHHADAGFQAGRFQGISDGGIGFGNNGMDRVRAQVYAGEDLDVQPVRTPSTLNVAYQKNMLWNGQFGATGVNAGTDAYWTPDTPKETNHLGYEGVETQAIAGLGVHRLGMDSMLLHRSSYKSLFDASFKEIPTDERYTKEFVGLAIAAYERTLLPNQAPFQLWLKGDKDAMTEQEKIGATLFFGKAQCGACHNGPALNNMDFHALGMNNLSACEEEVFLAPLDDPSNMGRGSFTGEDKDNFKFKTPQLYNLEDSKFLGHGGTFRSIRAVVEYKNLGVPENPNIPSEKLDPLFKPLNLTDQEIDDITAFITNGLYDPDLRRYIPDNLPSGNCFPVNDPKSKQDLGCE